MANCFVKYFHSSSILCMLVIADCGGFDQIKWPSKADDLARERNAFPYCHAVKISVHRGADVSRFGANG